jgi:hypothetical protein
MSYSPKRIVRILRPVWYVVAGEGPGVDGVGDTERARFGGCVTGIVTVDLSGRLDGPAIGVSGLGAGGFGWGGFSLCYRGIQSVTRDIIYSEAHFRGLSTSLELELVAMCYSSP